MNVPDSIDLSYKSARFERFGGGIAFVVRTHDGPGRLVSIPFVDIAHAREFMAFRDIELTELAADEVFGA